LAQKIRVASSPERSCSYAVHTQYMPVRPALPVNAKKMIRLSSYPASPAIPAFCSYSRKLLVKRSNSALA